MWAMGMLISLIVVIISKVWIKTSHCSSEVCSVRTLGSSPSLLIFSLIFSLLSRLTLPIPSLCFVGITCQLNYLDTRHCLRVCFGETPQQTFIQDSELGCSHSVQCVVPSIRESTLFWVLSALNSFVHPLMTFCLYLCCCWLISFVILSFYFGVERGWGDTSSGYLAFFHHSLPNLLNLIFHSAIICPQSHSHGTLTFAYLFHPFACALSLPGILSSWSDWQITTFSSKSCSCQLFYCPPSSSSW